jgi:hypothetical protein
VFTHSDSIRLRYVLLLNGLAALVPGMTVRGRANDPLLRSTWWPYEQHSAVVAVAAAAILGSVLVSLVMRRNLRRWWMFLLCGSFTGAFPGLFYLIVAPLPDTVLASVVAMLIIGVIWGALMGLVIYCTVGRKPTPGRA